MEKLGGEMTTLYTMMNSPVGELLLTSADDAITGLYMDVRKHGPRVKPDWLRRETALLCETMRQLLEYFDGSRREFQIPLKMTGSEFQKTVWNELSRIPYGSTISYGELARRIGNPSASRAVGLANGRNPISIIVPCHRVIGANGSLTGYGGGLERKQVLLALEAQHTFRLVAAG
jgi:methylated-DNA-[protein]-cysteine S-methyltransferase